MKSCMTREVNTNVNCYIRFNGFPQQIIKKDNKKNCC